MLSKRAVRAGVLMIIWMVLDGRQGVGVAAALTVLNAFAAPAVRLPLMLFRLARPSEAKSGPEGGGNPSP